jgi:hypothetical protein
MESQANMFGVARAFNLGYQHHYIKPVFVGVGYFQGSALLGSILP